MRLLLALALLAWASSTPAIAGRIEVRLVEPSSEPRSGRLIIFARPVDDDQVPGSVDGSPFAPDGLAVAARDVASWAPGQTVAIDGGNSASFPVHFAQLPRGRYQLQAVLDLNRNYNYNGRGKGDIISPVTETELPGPVELELRDSIEESDSTAESPGPANVTPLKFLSRRLSRFTGRATHISGWIALPPGYAKTRGRWPVVFSSDGFGSDLTSARRQAESMADRMSSGAFAPMVWVFLDRGSWSLCRLLGAGMLAATQSNSWMRRLRQERENNASGS